MSKKTTLYDVYGFDFVGVWFRIVTKTGVSLPRNAAGWPLIDRWSKSEFEKRAGENVRQQLEAFGYCLVMDSEPQLKFFSRRTLLHPDIRIEEVGRLDSEHQYIRIPQELSFRSRYVFVQTMKDGSLLIREMPKSFEREQEAGNAQSLADHVAHTMLIPALEARERAKGNKER